MNKHSLLLPAILLITITLAACGGISVPEADPVSSGPPISQIAAAEPQSNAAGLQIGSNGGELRPSTDAAVAADTAHAPSGGGENPAPSLAHVAPGTASAGSSGGKTPARTMTSSSQVTTPADSSSSESPSVVSVPPVGDAPSNDAGQAAPQVDLQALFIQAMASSELMRCLSSQVGMETLAKFSERAPTVEESQAVQSCLASEQAPTSSVASVVETAPAPRTLLEQAYGDHQNGRQPGLRHHCAL